MNVLKKCCYRSLKENRKRTVVTIIGIVLATALITGVACLLVSFQKSMVERVKEQDGDYHYCFEEVSGDYLKYFENNRNVEGFGLAAQLGYAILEGSINPDKPYVFVRALNESGAEALGLRLRKGRMPQTPEELVIASHILGNGGVEWNIGDRVTLSIGERVSEGYCLKQGNPYTYEEEVLDCGMERTYTIVGIVDRPNYAIEDRMAPGYSVFTFLGEEETANSLEIYAKYTRQGLKAQDRVTAGILGVSEELYDKYFVRGELDDCTEQEIRQAERIARKVTPNYWLLKWLLFDFSVGTMQILYGMAAIAVVVIMVTGVFCIHNSFVISLTEKMKLYGRLASVGTTRRQMKKIVYYEAFFLGGVGIPLGILSGILATLILLKAVESLVEEALELRLFFSISWPAVIVAAVLGAVTVFFSASQSARRAARVSPVEAIRANATIKNGGRKWKCPGVIKRCFGIGGTIAYKNLKRAKVKYRTTVISIVVSVAVFIGLTTFVSLMQELNSVYYQSMDCQIAVGIHDPDGYEKACRIAEMEQVDRFQIVRRGRILVEKEQIPYSDGAESFLFGNEYTQEGQTGMILYTLGREEYESYCKKLGVDPETAKDKAIIRDHYEYATSSLQTGKRVIHQGALTEFMPGDILSGAADGYDYLKGKGNNTESTGETEDRVELEVLCRTSEVPMHRMEYNSVYAIVSDEWLEEHPQVMISNIVYLYLQCRDADALEAEIRDMGMKRFTVSNFDASFRSERSLYLVISIFLYGFLVVVALIGVTNIFNTVTTNMELRAPEFAMLRSVGMTGKEFRRMIWLEGLFYGGKALCIGIPLGILISAAFYRATTVGMETTYRLPILGIVLSTAAVFLLLYGIMRYSMHRIRQKNIIETIRNENI